MPEIEIIDNPAASRYHSNLCAKLKEPLSKSEIMCSSFPNWLYINSFIKFTDLNCASFFRKPFYTLLNEEYLFTKCRKKAVICYTPLYYESTFYQNKIEGFLFKFTALFFTIQNIYEWEDIKEEADKFRPQISFRSSSFSIT